jgi:hypothetical protein
VRGDVAAEDYARHRSGQQRSQQWPTHRSEEPISDTSHQRQWHRVRDVGPDDDRHRQARIEQQQRRDTERTGSATYDPSDLVDRYESRLWAMIDATLKGEGIGLSEPAEPAESNVIDLMAALKKSLAQEAEPKKPPQSSAPAKQKRAAAAQAAKPGRKRA